MKEFRKSFHNWRYRHKPSNLDHPIEDDWSLVGMSQNTKPLAIQEDPQDANKITNPRQSSMWISANGTISGGRIRSSGHEASDTADAQRQKTLHSLRECLLGGGSIAFSGLDVVSQFAPVPYLRLAVTAASQILAISQSILKSRGDCRQLLDRTSTLLIVITPFADRALPNQETLESIERLAKTLTSIANDLRTIKADISFRQIRTAVKSILTNQAVQDRVNECSSKLDWAMRFFQSSVKTLRKS
ncbi:hypothetical protein FRB98_007495 [Tulasnella sp. 332]|nr:hypothetical protein FRB98_007495 [Tulasnella sp. 332]